MGTYTTGTGIDCYGAARKNGTKHALAGEFLSLKSVRYRLQRERDRILCNNQVGSKPLSGGIECEQCLRLIKRYSLTPKLQEAVR